GALVSGSARRVLAPSLVHPAPDSWSPLPPFHRNWYTSFRGVYIQVWSTSFLNVGLPGLLLPCAHRSGCLLLFAGAIQWLYPLCWCDPPLACTSYSHPRVFVCEMATYGSRWNRRRPIAFNSARRDR
ncbi:unnamed protein product, partial [Ectocarpus fasciculatus]